MYGPARPHYPPHRHDTARSPNLHRCAQNMQGCLFPKPLSSFRRPHCAQNVSRHIAVAVGRLCDGDGSIVPCNRISHINAARCAGRAIVHDAHHAARDPVIAYKPKVILGPYPHLYRLRAVWHRKTFAHARRADRHPVSSVQAVLVLVADQPSYFWPALGFTLTFTTLPP